MARLQVLLLGAILAASGGRALGAELISEPPESALHCLTVTGNRTLEYPKGKAEQKEGGVIRVRLTFTSADAPPRAEVAFASVEDVFREAVFEQVASYRLPCLGAGDGPIVAVQEFQFLPGDGRKVIWSEARDSLPLRNPTSNCVTGADHVPSYPSSAERRGDQAIVFAEYVFKDAVSAPDVTILYDGESPAFGRAVREYASGLRLPCMPADARPLRAFQSFTFSFDGRRSRLKDAALPSFLGVVDHLEDQHVRFDFTTMGCPFEVRFVLREPYLSNSVGEVEKHDPNRREFLEWLKTVKLDIPTRDLKQVLGDSMTITVPCSVIDLT